MTSGPTPHPDGPFAPPPANYECEPEYDEKGIGGGLPGVIPVIGMLVSVATMLLLVLNR